MQRESRKELRVVVACLGVAVARTAFRHGKFRTSFAELLASDLQVSALHFAGNESRKLAVQATGHIPFLCWNSVHESRRSAVI